MTETLIIYHIPGSKVGCTNDLSHRRGEYPIGTIFEVLETFTGTLEQGTEREFFWADHFGYNRGMPYNLARANRKIASSAGGKAVAATPNHNSKDPEHLKKWRLAGSQASAASPNHMSKDPENVKKWQAASISVGAALIASKASRSSPNRVSIKHLTCPHCGKNGVGLVMYRHHFDKCKRV